MSDWFVENAFVVVILLIVSNFAYLIPGYVAWKHRLYDFMAIFSAMVVISSVHHTCYDAGLCFWGASSTVISNLDVAYAIIAGGISAMSIALYDLIRVRHSQKMIGRGYTVGRYDNTEQYVLAKHSYADFFTTFYTVLIVALQFTIDNSLIIYGIAGLYVIGVVTLHLVLYWSMKKRTWRRRFYWPYIVSAIILAGFSVSIFAYLERFEGKRVLHSVWHISSAVSCALLLEGTLSNMDIDA